MWGEMTKWKYKGLLFVSTYDEEQRPSGMTSTDILAAAFQEAREFGCKTDKEVASYITTTTFRHVKGRAHRFNSVLTANDLLGAHIVEKLWNSIGDVYSVLDKSLNRTYTLGLLHGMVAATEIVLSPFEVERGHTTVSWRELKRLVKKDIVERYPHACK